MQVPGPENDNAPPGLNLLMAISQSWLSHNDRLGLLDCTQPALECTLARLVPKAAEGDDWFHQEDWLQCLMHLEVLVQPLPDEKLIGLQLGSYHAMEIMMEEQGLDRTVGHAIRQFHQHEQILNAMIVAGVYEPMLAVDCGMLDGLHDAFASDRPTMEELVRNTRRLATYHREPQHARLPTIRWAALNEIIDTGCAQMSARMKLRRPQIASVIDFSASRKPPTPR